MDTLGCAEGLVMFGTWIGSVYGMLLPLTSLLIKHFPFWLGTGTTPAVTLQLAVPP